VGAGDSLLLGTISLDDYLATGDVLPGGGILNMTWHWRRLGREFQLLTRIGEDGALIEAFLARNGVPVAAPEQLVAAGTSSTIDIEILPDRQPHMDHFVEGVWADYRLTQKERFLLARAKHLHAVLIEGAIAEIERLGDSGALAHIPVSADFLGFRHYTMERLAQTLRAVDLGFIGWAGDEDDPIVGRFREVALDLRRVLVITMGAKAVRVFDGRAGNGADGAVRDRRYPVAAVEVAGTTLGCGDAFIAWFLDELWRSNDVDAAVRRGMMGGAMATAWQRPLPDDAYR
jgi:sugar/nucleoside kinase (ribokinase family)